MVAVGNCLWTTNKSTEKKVSGRSHFTNAYVELRDNTVMSAEGLHFLYPC